MTRDTKQCPCGPIHPAPADTRNVQALAMTGDRADGPTPGLPEYVDDLDQRFAVCFPLVRNREPTPQ